jgi:multiple sugar transport system substrate-binding protein
LVALLLLLTLAAMAAACSKAPAKPVSQPAPEVTTIRVGAGYDWDPRIDQVIAAFQSQHPEYRVSLVDLKADPVDKLNQGAVDLVPGHMIWGETVRQGAAVALDPYIGKSRLDLAPFGTLIDDWRFAGQVYVLPIYGDPAVLVYNEQLVKAAGVTIPDAWTWEQLRTTAARLTHGSGDEKIWGLDTWGRTEDFAYLVALQRTAAGTDPDAQAVRYALDLWNTMVATDQSVPPSFVLKVGTEQTSPLPCWKGKAALCLLPLHLVMERPEYAGMRLAPFPTAPPNKPATLGLDQSYGISARSAQPEAAWAFLRFLAGPEGAAILARQGRFPVYSNEATRQAWSESTPPAPPGSDMLFRYSWYGSPAVYTPLTPRGTFYMGANRLLAGETTVDDVIRQYEAALSKAAKP